MKNYVGPGERVVYTNPNATTINPGDLVLMEDTVGVSQDTIAEDNNGVVYICGVFTVPKKTGASEEYAQGQKVYYDVVAKKITYTDNSAANPPAGICIEAVTTAATEVKVKLLY